MAQGPQLRVAFLISSLPWIVAGLPLRLAADIRPPRTRLLQRQDSAASERVEPYDFASDAEPNGHFELESTKSKTWSRRVYKERRRLLSSSERHSRELKRMSGDDTEGDSFLWGNLTSKEFRAEDTSTYWDDLCNGTNMSKSNKLPGDVATSKLNVTVVLSSWKLENSSACSEFVGANYTDALEAFKNCGATCDGLSYTKSEPTIKPGEQHAVIQTIEVRLCAVGGMRKQVKSDLNFVYTKPADFVSPKGQPRPPIELGFWRDFCTYRVKGRKLRIMFEGQNCAESVVKAIHKLGVYVPGEPEALIPPSNPVECAETAATDAGCSNVFDFRFGPPTVCRCLKKDALCSPVLSTAGHVYAPSLE